MASPQQQGQTINVGDLDLAQLADVRRQLEEVRFYRLCIHTTQMSNAKLASLLVSLGTYPPYELVHAAEAGASKVQILS